MRYLAIFVLTICLTGCGGYAMVTQRLSTTTTVTRPYTPPAATAPTTQPAGAGSDDSIKPPERPMAADSTVAMTAQGLTETITTTTVYEYTSKIKAPSNAVEAAQHTVPDLTTKDGEIHTGVAGGSTGARDAIDQALAQLNIWVLGGLGMVLLGFAYTIGIVKVPFMGTWPWWGSPLLIVGGFVVGSWPFMLDRYGGWIAGGMGGAAILLSMWIVSQWNNKKMKAKEAEALKSKPPPATILPPGAREETTTTHKVVRAGSGLDSL